MTSWHKAINQLRPFLFKISTPNGAGTGFQIHYVRNKQIYVISTAYHVIKHAFEWEEPIRLTHFQSKENILLKVGNREIIPYPDKDLAFILFNNSNSKMNLRQENLDSISPGKHLIQGVDIGWAGFPSVAPDELCFFSGFISACIERKMIYLIDGVAINGVSGGPAFSINPTTDKPIIAGVTTQYIPNRATGEALPGVCVAVHLEPYQKMLSEIRSWDDAGKEAERQISKVMKKQTFQPDEQHASLPKNK